MLSKLREYFPPLRSPLKLRTQLIVIVVAAMTPLFIFAVFMIYRAVADERATFRYGVVERARAILTAVDTELKSSTATLEALGTSNELDGDEIEGFHEDAARILQSQTDWLTISLADSSGRRMMKFLSIYTIDTPDPAADAEIDLVMRTGRSLIGGVQRDASGSVSGAAVAVRVPVVRRGVIRYVLSAMVKADAIAALLANQKLPDDWVLTVLDAGQRVVLRTHDDRQAVVAAPAAESLRAELARSDEGWTPGISLEGEKIYRSYIRSQLSGWTVAISIPAAAVDVPFHGPIVLVILFGIALIVLAVAVALTIGAKTAGSIEALSSVAGDLAAGKYDPPAETAAPSHIAEVENLRSAFLSAQRLIGERAEERNRFERELWRQASLLELTHDAIFVWDFPSRRIEYWNRAAEVIYGYTREEAIGRTLRDLLKTYHPRGIGYVGTIVEKQGGWAGELTHTTRDGRQIPVEVRLILSSDSSGRRFVLETVHDLTESKRAERRRRIRNAVNSILAGSPPLDEAARRLIRVLCESGQWDVGALWLVDEAAGELACVELWQVPSREAPEFAELTREARFGRGAGLPGRVWQSSATVWISDLMKDRHFTRAEAARHDRLRSGFCFPIKLGDDVLGVVECFCREVRPVEEDLFSSLATIGNQLGAFIQRSCAEEALRRLNEELEARVEERTAELLQSRAQQEALEEQLRQAQKMEALGTLAGGIAHDFNNILGIILGYAREMRSGSGVDPLGGLDVILDAADRGAKVVKQLLAFARKPSVAPAPVDLNALATNTVNIIRPVFPKTIACTIDLDPALPLIHGDENQLQQALINVLLNARDAMPEGGTIAIRTARDGERVRLAISDDGLGMDDNTRRRLFEPFFTTKQRTGGTGLGLSVVYGIVQAHGGTIEVESEPGRGTTLNLFFPVPVTTAAPQPARDAATRAVRGHGETILVVDDEPHLRELISSGAERRGFKAIAAADGPEALEIFRAKRDAIAVVVLDWGLPGLDGTAVFNALKEIKPDVDVIGISGYLEPEMQERVLKLGVREFLHKPCAPEEIFDRIARLCRRRLRPVSAA